MNILKGSLLKLKNNGIKVKKEAGGIRVINDTDSYGFLVYPKIFSGKKIKTVELGIKGSILNGNGAILEVLGLKREILAEVSFNSTATYDTEDKSFFIAIRVNRKTEVVISEAFAQFKKEASTLTETVLKDMLDSKNEILIVTPSYPAEENKYFGGFVHSRVKAYKEAGINFDLVCAHKYPNSCKYSFEGIEVVRTGYMGLRQLLTAKKYKTVLLHFFDEDYANVLDACDLSQTRLYLWVHGPETLYWDWSKMTDKYFEQLSPLDAEQQEKFKLKDSVVRRYNEMPNVKWVFVSEWIKKQSEELIGITFNNSTVIPNFIDEKNFDFVEKHPEARKKIFMLRRFENISKYAIDINVRAILELSKRECFSDLEFNVYGTGEYYDTLIAPIKDFPNVNLYQKFLTHEDISKVHKQNGIGLFATRYDAQGVSMCEAAMSGLAIVSSQNDAIREFLPEEKGILCDTEDYVAYADLIEKMYNEPDYFVDAAKACHQKVFDLCSFDKTINREIEMIKSSIEFSQSVQIQFFDNKALSIIIPSYNVSAYLAHGVDTMLAHKNAGKMEIIIVNDGSKDATVEVAKRLEEKYTDNIIKIIDKPNGGHGSTINAGLKIASGKFIRIIDGDDWVNSKDMEKLVGILETEEADVVVTDYCEDRATENEHVPKKLYSFMFPGKEYNFDDLCYDGYGFSEWGPILATANFKREVLVGAFTLTEKSFYIDMEFDAFSIERANTIKYYPLDIYRYFIGRVDQSISRNSYKRNFKQHEGVIFNLINYYYNGNTSQSKKRYILNKLVLPMVVAHYVILIQFLRSGKEYKKFEKKLSQYPEIYNNPAVATKMKKLHRKTGGIFVKAEPIIKKILGRG